MATAQLQRDLRADRLASAAVARYRFNEDAGSTEALDNIDGFDGSYESGAAPGAAGLT